MKVTEQVNSIADKLLVLFKEHIGHSRRLEQRDLFIELFKTKPTNSLQDWMRWEFTKRAMHKLRKYSNCFVISSREGISYSYFVAKNITEAKGYANSLNGNIKGLKLMQKKAVKSVNERWYAENWKLG